MRVVKSVVVLFFVAVVAVTLVYADVEKGKKLFNDPTFARSTNSKSCNSCHPDGRGVEKAATKTSFTLMGEKKGSLEDTVNSCIKMALKGKPIRKDSQQMKDIVEYIKSLEGKKFKKQRKIVGC